MSIGERIMRLVPDPDYERIRTELLLALADGEWQSTTELMRDVRNNPRGEFQGGPGTMFTTLTRLTEEGLVEITEQNGGGGESRRLVRLTEYGGSELEQMGAANL